MEYQNKIIRNDYVKGSGGYRCMFYRQRGTYVEHRQKDCEYIAEDNSIVIQWEGAPDYDSGYCSWYFPPTAEGLKEAHAKMDKL